MKRLYQKNWLDIEFQTFADMDPCRVADADFYERFYLEFFRQYQAWEDLDPNWISGKEKIAEFILSRLQKNSDSVLSIGCGLGAVERDLVRSGVLKLKVNETAWAPLRWLREIVADEDIHVGWFPTCIPVSDNFDLIYLSAVDCCFDQPQFDSFLKKIRQKLVPNGRCLVVSATFDNNGDGAASLIKEVVKTGMARLGLKLLGQLWGYLRNREEYRQAMIGSGFELVEDGFLSDGTYWIEGRKV